MYTHCYIIVCLLTYIMYTLSMQMITLLSVLLLLLVVHCICHWTHESRAKALLNIVLIGKTKSIVSRMLLLQVEIFLQCTNCLSYVSPIYIYGWLSKFASISHFIFLLFVHFQRMQTHNPFSMKTLH